MDIIHDTVYGYGVCVDDYYSKISNAKVVEFIKKAPKVLANFELLLDGPTCIEDASEIDIKLAMLEYQSECGLYGLGALIGDAMNEREDGIVFDIVDTFEGDQYILFLECMPWRYSEREKALTPDVLHDIFKKYFDELIDGDYEICSHVIENGV